MIYSFEELQKMNDQDIMDIAHDCPEHFFNDLRTRMEMIKHIYRVLGYDLTNDTLLSLVSTPPAKLIRALAGAGKTTAAVILISYLKFTGKSMKSFYYDGTNKYIDYSNILYLVYNAKNVEDVKTKVANMSAMLSNGVFEGRKIDGNVVCNTIHSYCVRLLGQVDPSWNNTKKLVTSDSVRIDMLRSIVDTYIEVLTEDLDDDPDDEDTIEDLQAYKRISKGDIVEMISLDTFLRETMTPLSGYKSYPNLNSFKMDISFVPSLLKKYRTKIEERKYYDFTACVELVINLLKNDDKTRKIVDSTLEYVIVDEVQDLSPLMFELVKAINGDKKDKKLMFIGDEDQSLYQFRGADITATLDFENQFEGGVSYGLFVNRRCRDKILSASQYVIDKNTRREPKEMKSVKEGGVVDLVPYSDKIGQYLKIVRYLKKIPREDYKDIVICSRDRYPSHYLTDLLMENKIVPNVMAGYNIRSHFWYRMIRDFLFTFFSPTNKASLDGLYKYFRSTGQRNWHAYVAKETSGYLVTKSITDLKISSNMFKGKNESQGEYLARCNRLEQMFSRLTKKLLDFSLRELTPGVVEFIEKSAYYKSYRGSLSEMEQDSEAYFKAKAIAYYTKDMTFRDLLILEDEEKKHIEKEIKEGRAVGISTFHSLKGLERKEVFIVDMDEDIFPNFKLIDSYDMTDENKTVLREAQICALYVAMTRAKDKLTIFYNESNPSTPILELMESDYESGTTLVTEVEEDVFIHSQHALRDKRLTVAEDVIFDDDISFDSDMDIASMHSDTIELDFDVDEEFESETLGDLANKKVEYVNLSQSNETNLNELDFDDDEFEDSFSEVATSVEPVKEEPVKSTETLFKSDIRSIRREQDKESEKVEEDVMPTSNSFLDIILQRL